MKLIDAIGKRIQELMLEKELTQYALCKKAAISESCLYNIFYKRQKDVPTSRLFLICEALGVTIQEFYNSPFFSNIEID